jgi:hypothetical protein
MSLGPLRWLVCALCVVGCEAGAPGPTVSHVKPSRGYTDRPLRLRIEGDGFQPSFRIDQASGVRQADVSRFSGRVGGGSTTAVLLHDFDWLDPDTMSAWMDPHLSPGWQPLQLTDPRGQTTIQQMAFFSLGDDTQPPLVELQRPAADATVGPGVTVDVTATASDAEPGTLQSLVVEASAGTQLLVRQTCRLEQNDTQARCDLSLRIPDTVALGDQLTLQAVATDRAARPNHATALRMLTLVGPPAVASVDPTIGGTAGGTELVIKGSGFTADTHVSIGDLLLLPHGGTLLDEHTITGRAPAHIEGPATVLVRNAVGPAQLVNAFTYRPPPQITSITPEIGVPEGGTPVRVRGKGFTISTQIYFGDTLVSARLCPDPKFVDEQEIDGVAPQGSGHTSVWAFDPTLGWSRLTDGFGWGTAP